jgi:hypothetical protein
MLKELNIEKSLFRKKTKPTKQEDALYTQTRNTVYNLVVGLRDLNVSKDSIKSVVEAALDAGLEITKEERLNKVKELHGLLGECSKCGAVVVEGQTGCRSCNAVFVKPKVKKCQTV